MGKADDQSFITKFFAKSIAASTQESLLDPSQLTSQSVHKSSKGQLAINGLNKMTVEDESVKQNIVKRTSVKTTSRQTHTKSDDATMAADSESLRPMKRVKNIHESREAEDESTVDLIAGILQDSLTKIQQANITDPSILQRVIDLGDRVTFLSGQKSEFMSKANTGIGLDEDSTAVKRQSEWAKQLTQTHRQHRTFTMTAATIRALGLDSDRIFKAVSMPNAERFSAQIVNIVRKRHQYALDNYPKCLLNKVISVQYVNHFIKTPPLTIASRILGYMSMEVKSSLGNTEEGMIQRILSIPAVPMTPSLLSSGGIYVDALQSKSTHLFSLYGGMTIDFGDRLNRYVNTRIDNHLHTMLVQDASMKSNFRIVSIFNDMNEMDMLTAHESEAVIVDFIRSVDRKSKNMTDKELSEYDHVRQVNEVDGEWTGINQETPWRRIQGMIVDGKTTSTAEIVKYLQDEKCVICHLPEVDGNYRVCLVDPRVIGEWKVYCQSCDHFYRKFLAETDVVTPAIISEWVARHGSYVPIKHLWAAFKVNLQQNEGKCPCCLLSREYEDFGDDVLSQHWRASYFQDISYFRQGGTMICYLCCNAYKKSIAAADRTRQHYLDWIPYRRRTVKKP